ncbi:5-methyltetrahydropteroyltriglutamate-homocysteine methyltransferase [Sesbania bispinosa]|nr:5-methyltetrahydropteroyltriglutamate-homocysteine methyltransferase [Sesbania bispinosa]
MKCIQCGQPPGARRSSQRSQLQRQRSTIAGRRHSKKKKNSLEEIRKVEPFSNSRF